MPMRLTGTAHMMRFSWVVLLGCGHASEPPKPVATHATANAAYAAKHYGICAEQFTIVAKTVTGAKRADELYSAACCHALDGKTDLAFAALDEAVALGFRDVTNFAKDPDLASLHGDPRWATTLDRITAQIAAWEKSLGNPALRRELLELVKKDQDARFAYIAKDKAGEHPDMGEMAAIDAVDLIALHRIVDASGWPGKQQVGDDGAHAAWLMVQHADKDVPFQKDVLAKMKPLADADEVSMTDYAYLYDRVAVGEHRKQLYGTQFNEHQQPQPIEDEANVDARRKAVGMGTMDEYRAQQRKMYGAPK
jgi:hypothetical protein